MLDKVNNIVVCEGVMSKLENEELPQFEHQVSNNKYNLKRCKYF